MVRWGVSSPGPTESGFTLGRPTVLMAFACENVSTDFAGRVSFQNLIDALLTPSFPATTPQMFVIFSFWSQLASFLNKPTVVIEDENQARIAEVSFKDMAFTPDSPVARAMAALQGVQWPHAGPYVVKFIANGGQYQAAFPITVVHQPVSSGGPPGTS